MDEDFKKPHFGMELLRMFAVVFTPALLVIVFTGMIIARFAPDAKEVSSLFALGNGLSFSSILQIAGIALIFAVFSMLLISERFFPALRFIYRILLFFVAALIAVSVFSVIFQWFPADDKIAWLAFFLSFASCYAASTILTLLGLKHEKKKYGKLLADYKARQNTAL